MWLAMSFVALGFLIGNLIGLTAASVVASVLGLLFAFLGGSVIALLRRLSADDRRAAGQALCGLSTGCLAGLYVGILVSERQLLSAGQHRLSAARNTDSTRSPAVVELKYLRSDIVKRIDAIDLQYTTQSLSCPEAYSQLLRAVRTADDSGASNARR
jgi:hypothetical protein